MAETNLQVIQRASATMGMDNPEGHATVKELLDPDFVVIEPDGLPYAGTYRGPDGWWTVFRRMLSTWTDIKHEPIFLMGDPAGENFALMVRLSGRSLKTGKPFETTVMEHWVVRNGRVVSSRPHYFDTKYLWEVCHDEVK